MILVYVVSLVFKYHYCKFWSKNRLTYVKMHVIIRVVRGIIKKMKSEKSVSVLHMIQSHFSIYSPLNKPKN